MTGLPIAALLTIVAIFDASPAAALCTQPTACVQTQRNIVFSATTAPQTLCRQRAVTEQALIQCTLDAASSCTPAEQATLTADKNLVSARLTQICNNLPIDPGNAGSQPQCDGDGERNFQAELGLCKETASTWTQFVLNGRSLQEHVCSKVQLTLDCMWKAAAPCAPWRTSVKNDAVAYINMAAIFGCKPTLGGAKVVRSLAEGAQTTACDIYEWIKCFNPMFRIFGKPEMTSKATYDLKTVWQMTANIPQFYSAILDTNTRPATCRKVSSASLASVGSCAKSKCAALSAGARSDALWYSVQPLMFNMSRAMTLLNQVPKTVDQLCSPACADYITKVGQMNTCLNSAPAQAQAVKNAFNARATTPFSASGAQCQALKASYDCARGKVGQCAILQNALTDKILNTDHKALIVNLCGIDLSQLYVDPAGCADQDYLVEEASRYTLEFPSRTTAGKLLAQGITAKEFCDKLSVQIVSGLTKKSSKCRQVELGMWHPYQRFAATLNHFLGPACSLQQHGLDIAPINEGAGCSMAEVEDCMTPVKMAFQLNTLNVAAVQALIIPLYDITMAKNAYCPKLRGLNWPTITNCYRTQMARCQWAHYTLGGATYTPMTHPPLDPSFLQNQVDTLCTPQCDKFLEEGEKFQSCFQKGGDNNLKDTLTQRIVYHYVTDSNNDLEKDCYLLDQVEQCLTQLGKCKANQVVIDSFVKRMDVVEVKQICKAFYDGGGRSSSGANGCVATWLLVMATALLLRIFG